MERLTNDLPQRIHSLQEGLKQAGVKLTHQRLEICREIAGASNHPDAETVYTGVRKRVPTISLDTVYRTLWLLIDLKLINTLGTPHERVRFDGNIAPHHHFICIKCGKAHDFSSNDSDHLEIPNSVRDFGTVEKTQVEIKGICSSCSRNG